MLVPALREGDENFFGVDGSLRVTLGLPTGDIWGFTFRLTLGARSQILLTHSRAGDAER